MAALHTHISVSLSRVDMLIAPSESSGLGGTICAGMSISVYLFSYYNKIEMQDEPVSESSPEI